MAFDFWHHMWLIWCQTLKCAFNNFNNGSITRKFIGHTFSCNRICLKFLKMFKMSFVYCITEILQSNVISIFASLIRSRKQRFARTKMYLIVESVHIVGSLQRLRSHIKRWRKNLTRINAFKFSCKIYRISHIFFRRNGSILINARSC